jgi:hypothetical protein
VYEHIDVACRAVLGDNAIGGDPLDRVGLERDVGAVERREVLVVESRALAAE